MALLDALALVWLLVAYYFHDQVQQNDALWANAILSRYPIGAATPNDLGVSIDVDGRTVFAFNIHLTNYPYQPYQLLGIAHGEAPFLSTEVEAIEAARGARQAGLDLLLADLGLANEADASFVFGDFNEPSHRDWTARAAEFGRHPIAVHYPTTAMVEKAGYLDTFRAAFPDELARPGFTWGPMSDPIDPGDHPDR